MPTTDAEHNLLKNLSAEFEIKGQVQRQKRIMATVKQDHLLPVCSWLHNQGFSHLSAISATDWPEKKTFELTHHLWSYEQKMLITVKTNISREKPEIESVISIWDNNAQIHERELHELFGIQFKGNPDLAPLFAEEWDGPPAFRKDFDWRTYVQKHIYKKDAEREQGYYD